MTTKDRKNKAGELLGPRPIDKYMDWRRARDNAIANPRRAKHVREAEEQKEKRS